MTLSVFDLFTIGIGPSSSHTVGPMKAAGIFANALLTEGLMSRVSRVRCDLYGSLAATAVGHGTLTAVVLGLSGLVPERCDPAQARKQRQQVEEVGTLELAGVRPIEFEVDRDIVLRPLSKLPFHPNALTFSAMAGDETELLQRTYYSVGGGFIVDDQAILRVGGRPPTPSDFPYPFDTADELLAHCADHGMSVAEVMMANECTRRTEVDVRRQLLEIWMVMSSCIDRGVQSDGVLPGGLGVVRRAKAMASRIAERPDAQDRLGGIDLLTLYALAVNEENAAGGRVVTAPTNGAAGIIPSVLRYYHDFVPGAGNDGLIEFLLTAGAIGVVFKKNASISGAEVGCQGEVGSACAMAAAGLTAVLGGSPSQVENAAEVAMEHNLGLTCDPVGGLVQIPCIERNAIAAVKAVTAARTAMFGDGRHIVSLDVVVRTMLDTGRDMKSKYKETARGGLAVKVAVNLPDC